MPADKASDRGPGHGAGRTALQARIAYESAHPEIAITSPLTSGSGWWELTTADGTATFSAVQAMLDFLATRFGPADGG
jgi:hypothetical protein